MSKTLSSSVVKCNSFAKANQLGSKTYPYMSEKYICCVCCKHLPHDVLNINELMVILYHALFIICFLVIYEGIVLDLGNLQI